MAESDCDNQATNGEPQGEQSEPQGSPIDWESKYNEAVKQSRKWEERAKANREKAEKWDAYESEGISAAGKMQERAERAEAELAELRAADAKRNDAEEVSKETGVPMSLLLHCPDRGDMEKFAKEYEGENRVHAAPSAPSSRIIRGGEHGISTRDKFARYFEE